MYCLKDSGVLSESFKCTVRKILMYCPKHLDVLLESFKCVVGMILKGLCFFSAAN